MPVARYLAVAAMPFLCAPLVAYRRGMAFDRTLFAGAMPMRAATALADAEIIKAIFYMLWAASAKRPRAAKAENPAVQPRYDVDKDHRLRLVWPC